MKILFVSTNEQKIAEAQNYLKYLKDASDTNVDLGIVRADVTEILDSNIEKIARHKALEAYRHTGLPCLVEHGGLFMKDLPNLPGGIGKIIWEAVGDRMCSFLGEKDSREATAVSVIGYCDGRRIRIYRGETRGQVAISSRGDYKYNWDPIFIPEGSKQTYGEMGPEKKRATSPSVKAWDAFLKTELQINHGLINQ
ncbi:MAG TPA: non-canonical purine NTP pyrophosphatase [Pyrinomonadaceae bacterium]|jgi:XTP/dITP diphosphohydrolase|nr:non-canonical purine NTP pyrophosphatase [Pyrinomonadaceae bacterium]